MDDTHAGGTAGILEDALALAGAGRLDNAARARLWALVAGGVIAGGTAHALVEIDVQARGRAGKARKGGTGAAAAAKREEIRLAWADLSTAEQNRSKGRRKTGPFSVMRYAVLRVVPLVHRRAPRCFA